jgi:hypothetical protein
MYRPVSHSQRNQVAARLSPKRSNPDRRTDRRFISPATGSSGMPLQYMHNLGRHGRWRRTSKPWAGPNEVLPDHSRHRLAWIQGSPTRSFVYTPLHPTAPFVTVYGLRQLTKRELAGETLRCIHRWMIEHPWGGERHKGIPEWKLSGEKSPGVSAKLVWLSMISPVGDGRWVTQLQKAPGPST